jgi:hypothetical protein
MVKVIKFSKFVKSITEGNTEEYASLLDDVMSLLDTTGGQLPYIKKSGDTYTAIQISGENYVEIEVKGSEQNIIKTQKLYKDGEITNYDLAITRLKDLKKAIQDEQFVPTPEDSTGE